MAPVTSRTCHPSYVIIVLYLQGRAVDLHAGVRVDGAHGVEPVTWCHLVGGPQQQMYPLHRGVCCYFKEIGEKMIF